MPKGKDVGKRALAWIRAGRRLLAGLALALVLAGLSSSASASTAAWSSALVGSLKQNHSVLFGAAVPTRGSDLSELDRLEVLAGKRPALVLSYVGFARDGFDRAFADAVWQRGSIPLVTWEPWDDTKGVRQPAYSLGNIIDGRYDAYIRGFAEDAKEWGHPLFLRFAHEMNGTWYPWSEAVNGNRRGDYVRAWRHVHDVFAAVGASNVVWVWSPNVLFGGSLPLERLYPGDRYVDWVGLDGYNWGPLLPWTTWQTPAALFGPTLARIRRLTRKPIMISEVGSTEVGGSKERWIRDFFDLVARRNADILAFVWFNYDKETDWRVQSSSGAASAFAEGLADRRFLGAPASLS